MWVAAILIGAIVGLIAMWVMDRRYNQQTIQRIGLRGPKPNFLLGNFKEKREIAAQEKNAFVEWEKKYGKTFGYYEGAKPVIVTSDIELTKEVLIKSFGTFHSRRPVLLAPSEEALARAQGEQWKRLRMIVSPTFSAGRMKEMSPLVNKCVTDLLDVLEKRVQEETAFNITKDFQGFTLSTIALCGFGLEVDALNDEDNIFLKKCRETFALFTGKSPLFKYVIPLAIVLPSLLKILKFISHDSVAIPCQWFFDTAEKIIEERKTNKDVKRRRDFIELMLEAEDKGMPDNVTQLEVKVDQDAKEPSHSDSNSRSSTASNHNVRQGKGMTLREIQSQCMSFLLAGFETTSTALSFAAYELARNPEIQKKLQDEIDELLPKGSLPDYLSVQRMPYLDQFFSEVGRLHINAETVLNRQCFEDITIGGLHIPKGTGIQINVKAIHRDPELWGPEDPDLFVPERFQPDRKAARPSVAYLAFGGGPRNCIGMRFGLMEVKIVLARILRDYTVMKAGEQKLLPPNTMLNILRPIEDVFVRLEKREK